MQNIDPVYFLTPVVTMAFSFGLVAYWKLRKSFTGQVLLFSLVAYAVAIALKEVVQALTYHPFDAAVRGDPAALGIYFGVQTMVFEVGGAYLVARYAVSKGRLGPRDAGGFGVGLAMWENGVLVGGELLLAYAVYYGTLASGGPQATELLNQLLAKAPALFYPPSAALPLIGYAVLERVSSLLFHFSWGLLVVMAALLRRKVYLWAALPMGLVDFLPSLGLRPSLFEGLLFALGVLCLAVALALTRGAGGGAEGQRVAGPPSLVRTTFLRAIRFGKIYVGMGLVLPLLVILPIGGAGSASGSAAALVGQLPALILPMFVVVASMGGLLTFTSDRGKGVYEYLIAYGVDTSAIFWSVLASSLFIASIVLAFGIAEAVAVLVASGAGVSVGLAELFLFYTVPLSLAAVAFMCSAGMVWSSLTTQMAGVNSQVGVAPLLGIAPVMVVLILSTRAGGAFLYLVGGATLVLLAASASMVYAAARKLVRERFLSNA